MNRLVRTPLAAMALVLLAACMPGPDPERYEAVGVAFNRLHRDPMLACSYVSAHRGDFTAEFAQCGLSHQRRLADEITRLQRECNEIFDDPHDLLACDEDRGVPGLQQQALYLAAMLEITVAGGSCQAFGAEFQPMVDLFNSVQPFDKTWQQTMDESLPGHRQAYACGG